MSQNLSQRRIPPFLLAFLASLLFIHLPLFLFFYFFSDDWQKNDLQVSQVPKAIVVNLKKQKLPIADIDQPKKQEKPEKASVQSQYNVKVKEETVAKKFSSKESVARQSARKKEQKKSSSSVTKSKPQKNKNPSQNQPVFSQQIKQPQSLQDQLLALQNQQKQEEMASLKKFETNTKLPETNLSGSRGDYYPDYKVGNRTYLNALANPYVGYYVELKRKFKMAWNPFPALRRQLDQISRGKITVVWGVSVDASGKIKDLVLIRGSGLSGYDQEARRTITVSAPFRRPPQHLLKEDGMLHMAWTFVVYL